MKALKVLFAALHFIGFAGIGVLFIYIEWTFLRLNFSDIYNPTMHLAVLWKMLVLPLFWVLLAITAVGYFGKLKLNLGIEKRLRKEWGKSE